jgi:hypothetical protein
MLSARIYLDDDSASPLLATLLRRAGHDVVIPASLGLTGENDPVHLLRALQDRRVLLSGNHDDFEELHELILTAGGHHSGLFIVRRDNDTSRDLSPAGIVRAVRNLLAGGMPIEDNFHILNHWR